MRAPRPDDQPACFCFEGAQCHGTDPHGYDPYTRLGSRLPVLLISPWVRKGTVVSAPTHGPSPDSQYDGTSIVATVKRLFDLPNFLTRRDAWAAPFDHLFDELPAPRADAPMHLPDAPPPTPRHGKHPYGTDCDDPTRRMRRSIRGFEAALSTRAPARLHACAAAEPLWATRCEAGTMLEASEWLANATRTWRDV